MFDNWRRFCRPSVIFVPLKCPRGGGIWSPEWTLVWGIWTAFLARVGGNLNNNFQKVKCPGGCPGGACWSFDLTDTLGKLYLSASKYNNYFAYKTKESFILQPIGLLPRDWQNLFAITRFRIKVLFPYYFTIIGVQKSFVIYFYYDFFLTK